MLTKGVGISLRMKVCNVHVLKNSKTGMVSPDTEKLVALVHKVFFHIISYLLKLSNFPVPRRLAS